MLRALLLTSLCLFAPEEVRLQPGQRLEGVERVELEIVSAGAYTLGRSNGALVIGGQRSDDGWLTVELEVGLHVVELPDGPGDLTALPGTIEPASTADFINRAIGQINAADFPGASISLLACRAQRSSTATSDGLALMFQGSLAQRGGRLVEARELLLASREAVDAYGESDLIAFSADSLGQVALELEDWGLAQECFERVRDLADGPAAEAYAVSRLATVAAGRRETESARDLHEEALAMLTDESEATYVSSVAFEAGRFFQHRAEFARAAGLLERAAASAPRWDQEVAALGQLGLVEMVRGRYGAALGLMDDVQALAAEHSPSPYDATVLRARAVLAYTLGEHGVARECLEQVLELEDDPDDRAELIANLALLSYVQDDGDDAARLFDEALDVSPEASRSRWFALNGKAGLLSDRHLPEQAEPLLRAALELAERIDDPYLRAASLIGLSSVVARQGRGDDARRTAEAAVESLEGQDARDLLLPGLHSLARAALVQGDEATAEGLLDRAWQESLRADLSALSSLEEAQVRSRISELSDWGEVAVDLTARRAAQGPATLAAGFRQAERWKVRALRSEIQGRPDVPDGLEEALRPVLAGRALVEYVAGEDELYAFVVQDEALRFVELGDRASIERLVEEFVDGLIDVDHLATPDEVARVGKSLHERLLRPLGLTEEGVVVVPSGDLARLPFEALVVAAPPEVERFDEIEFVLDRMDLGYGPSAATLVALAQREKPSGGDGVLLLGDPTYVSEAAPGLLAARGTAATRWERLPHTRAELSRVARVLLTLQGDDRAKDDLYQLALLEESRDVSLSTASFELRLGREASVDALRSLAPHAGVIHIAAHAQVDRWDTRRTGLVLAWDDTRQGLFGLADIAALELDTELVVLSACQTADGRLLNGEGVQSMADAFLAAGARGVVATLWPVSDAQSQALMERFATAYLAGGETPERALRLAKRELRGAPKVRGEQLKPAPLDPRRGHPHDWAPFLFSGATEARTAR
ncbi:MAG: CHAT domain-containing protein [Planctomycetota bacterium]|jgi:CHAT domain-containing protein/tetratricopeptide (TPR) repeat protein